MINSLRFSRLAKSDIRKILAQSEKKFGQDAVVRYDLLVQTALEAIAENPLLGRPLFVEDREGVKVLHLRHVLRRTPQIGKVKSPRHMIIYFVVQDRQLWISRILHDAMDVARHKLPRKS